MKKSNQIDPYGICGRKAMAHIVLCIICGNLTHRRCEKAKCVNGIFAMSLKFNKCERCYINAVD